MPSTYTSNLGIEKIGTGEQSGTWGATTNRNLDIVDRATNGSITLTLSGTSSTLATSNGALSDGQNKLLVLGGTPSGTHTITIIPNTAEKVYYVINGTSESVVFTQGSGGNVTILAGDGALIYSDGGGSGAAVAKFSDTFFQNAVQITGGTVTGITDLAVADGGTGASTAADALVNLGLTATAAELNTLDGITASTAELNILDGVTATAAELNLLGGKTAEDFFPSGGIIMWSGSVVSIPSGWFLCDGANGTPDLRNRFVVGAGDGYAVGDTGGADSVTLSESQIPDHTHTFSGTTNTTGSHTHEEQNYSTNGSGDGPGPGASCCGGGIESSGVQTKSAGAHSHTFSGTTDATGSGDSHENRPPYFALAYIMKA